MEQKEHNCENESFGFTISLFTDSGEMSTLWLPAKPDGFYSFSERTDCKFLSFEGRDNHWYAFCKRPGFFRNTPPGCYSEVLLEDHQYIEAECEDKSYSLLVEMSSSEKMSFTNYTVHSEIDITIGNQPANDITYSNKLISPEHAILSRKDGKWYIKSCTNRLDIYVNRSAVNSAPLTLGDSIFIMGLQILIGTNFISVNSLRDDVLISDRILRNTARRHIGYGRYSGQEPEFIPQEEYFNRLPRKCSLYNSKTISIESPPMSTEHAQMPLMLRMGSSMVMSGKAAMTGNYTMLLTSLLFPLLSSNYSDTQRKNYESLRSTKYTEYLESKRQEILVSLDEEADFLNSKYPDLFSFINQPDYQKHIWERRPQDNDFLTLRIGRGKRTPCTKIDYPDKHFDLSTDPLEDKLYQLAEQRYILENVPITFSATECTVLGISGQHEQRSDLIHQLITQIVFFHSYDEVKLVFLIDSEDLKEYEFIRFLPHVWDDQKTVRFIVTNESEAYKLGEYLRNQLPDNIETEKDLHHILKQRPYYMVFAMNKRLLSSIEILKTVMGADINHGISVFTVFDDLPKECKKIISLEPHGEHTLISLNEGNTDDVRFLPDYFVREKALPILQKLSNLNLKSISQEQELPKMITFLEMFQVGRVEQLKPLQRWQENNPTHSLATPVGVAADGSLFMLDLHEKFQGPHGLVAGMTGSGKSEFIITYILSMAINFHPNEVSFILIDYKGGGLADAFDNPENGIHLPHLVGTITNLDGSSIQRSLRSLHSEVLRRQRVFKEAKAATGESTMDIYKYQKLYRKGLLNEPMPHLFIISDEFAELKQQKPEFMDNLISIARIGRSLGVHLILATQKPSGVVNDQIRSNSKFRVCLKVQEKADSQDMLKRPEAAELKDTGRFYLQVGYNEFFALGQSAWTGADYEPYDEVVPHKDDSVQFIDSIGQYTYEAKKKSKKQAEGKSQLNAVVELLSRVAQQEQIQRKSLWKPELPKLVSSDFLASHLDWNASSPTEVLVGIIDDPENQNQYPLLYDVQNDSSLLVIGEQGSGKTVVIQNILLSLSKACSPEQLNIYILDYSSRMMNVFKKLPHCGAVLFEEDTDSLDNFFGIINGVVTERKKLFSALEVDSYSAANALTPIPLILVVIDGFTGLKTTKVGDMHAYNLKDYIKNSHNYGIRFIISCNHTSDISSKIRQELGCTFALQLKDKYEYSDALKHSVSFVPTAFPGRGLLFEKNRCLEFQAATIYSEIGTATYLERMKTDIDVLVKKYKSSPIAKRLPVLSPAATYEDFSSQFSRGRIPLGYDLRTKKPIALPLKQFNGLSIYFGNPNGKIPILENLLFAAKREMMDIQIVPQTESSVFDISSEHHIANEHLLQLKLLQCNRPSLVALWKNLFAEITIRRKILNDYCTLHHLDEKQKDIVKYSHNYMAEHSTPLLILIENLVDFASHIDPASALVYDKLFRVCHKCNIYFVAGIEPEDDKRDGEALIFSSFTSSGSILFSGGQLDKQSLHMFSEDELKGGQIFAYNLCWMKYRDNVHPLLMPCGILEDQAEDEDDASIF